ncbi:hypothetical protein MMC26_004716 [Xylographa opegraphella]|nr:hypothetical protein [Xylographa opegraphella]
MEPLSLKLPRPVEAEFENWDDDVDLQGFDDLQFRNVSSTTVGTSFSSSHHRDSISSRTSVKSDIDGDELVEMQIVTGDDAAMTNAIASAKRAGIPIPSNVPSSALLAGTIKRLGGRQIKKALREDWGEDLELPKSDEGGLKLKKNEEQEFPDQLRHISAAFIKTPSPSKPTSNMSFLERIQSAGKARATVSVLAKFRDDENNDDFGDVPTIRVAKNRPSTKMLDFTPPQVDPAKASQEVENFEEDLIFPADGEPLKLSARKDIPKPPVVQKQDDFDADWGDGSQGSLGTSLGGTRRTGRSNRSSSISALSPSVFSPSLSSCLTVESEDEGLDGLVLPDGPLKLEEALKKRVENASPDPTDGRKPEVRAAAKEDFFTGIEIGDGDVFDSGKLTLNRNIKHILARQTSPTRRTAVTLTFTNKPQAITTRIPKLQTHDRNRSKLESVSEEKGVPALNAYRSQSRVGGHSAQSSVSSIPTPSTTSFPLSSAPSTPSRRGLNTRPSREAMRAESSTSNPPTTTSAQLLKAKRSVTGMRNLASPARVQSYQRPPSRSENPSRTAPPSRPKTPVDRSSAGSNQTVTRRPPVPFLSAGNGRAQSHHVSSKRSTHRPNSSDSSENIPLNRPISRLSNPHYRSTSPSLRRDVAPESLAREAAAKRTLTKPTRRRAFGDGSELDVFDDLPTSAATESKFVKQPIRSKPSNLRTKLNTLQNPSTSSLVRMDATTLSTPLSPQKNDLNVPRFARDTAASRTAREQRIGPQITQPQHGTHAAEPHTPLAPLSSNWKSRVAARPLDSPRHNTKRSTKPPQKPQLIKPLGHGVHDTKNVNGMHYNPQLYRWEGNENALAPFDVPSTTGPGSPKAKGLGIQSKPALIANFGSVKGVQVVGGMVFDPQRMCWLKMAPNASNPRHHRSESGGMSPATEDDEDDVFAGLDDLEDGHSKSSILAGQERKEGNLADDEWLVGEEFDVGPEFIRRQRAEEEKWRRKVDGWVGQGAGREDGDEWKWAIRGLVGL